MTRIRSFKPIVDKNSTVLILGSMPGRASLSARQYYAHPQNSFWPIMVQLLQMKPGGSYEEHVESIKNARIAVWDVLKSCVREGSLDAGIEPDTQIANDFRAFFRTYSQIGHVFFNGAKAEACFKRHVLQQLGNTQLGYLRLPSTSPANASLSYPEKLDKWRVILQPIKLDNT
jgi:TDG/mug DNA glycosylase family protein